MATLYLLYLFGFRRHCLINIYFYTHSTHLEALLKPMTCQDNVVVKTTTETWQNSSNFFFFLHKPASNAQATFFDLLITALSGGRYSKGNVLLKLLEHQA